MASQGEMWGGLGFLSARLCSPQRLFIVGCIKEGKRFLREFGAVVCGEKESGSFPYHPSIFTPTGHRVDAPGARTISRLHRLVYVSVSHLFVFQILASLRVSV